jgi:hypothetical protein
MAITCDCCENIFPEAAESKGEWIAGNSDDKKAVWLCSFCARSMERFRCADDLDTIREEHEANCEECGAERDPDDPGPKLVKES